MPATAGNATTLEGTGHGAGSFVEASAEKKVLTRAPPRQVVMSNTLIIPSSFWHTHYALFTSVAAVRHPPIVCNFISEQIGHWKSLTGAELNSLTWIRL